MAENIIDIESKQPHLVYEVMCQQCGSRWIVLHPECTLLKELQCHKCMRNGFVVATGQILEETYE